MHALGWRHDLEPRDELHRTAAPFQLPNSFRAPAEVDHRGWLKVENQGQLGSCSGHAITSVQEVLNYVATGGQVVQLSRMFGYLAGQQQDNLLGSDQGATITGSVRGARETGCCRESTFPYPQRYTPQIPQPALDEAGQHRVRQHSVLKSYDDCFRWLASGVGAIEIGILWTASLAENTTGVIDAQNGSIYGGHALAVVGYSARTDAQGRQYLWLVNSHGPQWGRQGWAEIAPALFNRWGRDTQSELIGVTDLAAFAPREIRTWEGMIG